MQEGVDFRQFIYKVSETSKPDKKKRPRFRETQDTAILGMLSFFLGVLVSIFGLMAILKLRDIDLNRESFGYPQRWLATIAAFCGELVGVSGWILGRWRGGIISPFCAVGVIASLIAMTLIAYNRN